MATNPFFPFETIEAGLFLNKYLTPEGLEIVTIGVKKKYYTGEIIGESMYLLASELYALIDQIQQVSPVNIIYYQKVFVPTAELPSPEPYIPPDGNYPPVIIDASTT